MLYYEVFIWELKENQNPWVYIFRIMCYVQLYNKDYRNVSLTGG